MKTNFRKRWLRVGTILFTLALLTRSFPSSQAAVWQYSIVGADRTHRALMFVPPACEHLRGAIMLCESDYTIDARLPGTRAIENFQRVFAKISVKSGSMLLTEEGGN